MKKIVLLCCLVWFATNTYCVERSSSYCNDIIVIEKVIAKEDFTKAVLLYQTFFRKYNRVLAKDAYNACQIAAYLKHHSFNSFYYECAKSGVSKSILQANIFIKASYRLSTQNLDSSYSSGHSAYVKHIDTTLRKEFIQRYYLEQKSKGKPEYAAVCMENFMRIKALSEQGRFPGEDLIGTNDSLTSYIVPTLLHYPYSYRILQRFLWDAVEEHKISPMTVLYVYSFNQTRTSVLYKPFIPVDTSTFKICYNLPFGQRSTNIAEVDKQRNAKKVMSVETQKALENLNQKIGIEYKFGY